MRRGRPFQPPDTKVMFAVRYDDGRSAYIRVSPEAARYGPMVVMSIAREQQKAGDIPDGPIVSVQQVPPHCPPTDGGERSQCPRWAGEWSLGFHRSHSSPLERSSAILGSEEACEAGRDRSVAVFPEHPVQGIKGAVREPPCARQKSVVLSFEAVGWCRPSLLAHLSILSHRFSGRTLCTFLAPNLGRQALRALIKLRLRRRTRTRVVH